MISLNVKFESSDERRIEAAFRRLIRRLVIEKDQLPMRSAIGFQNTVRRNILTGKFNHPAYSPMYAEWKERYGRFQDSWRLMGDAVSAITVFKDPGGDGWAAGIPAEAMDSGGKNWARTGPPKPIAMYLKTLEYGLAGQKERAVFVPTTVEFRNDQMPRELEQSKQKLKGAWK